MDELVISEKDFCRDRGLSREEMKAIRDSKMTEGVHWGKKGREIWLAPAAVQMIDGAIAELAPGDFEKGPQVSGETPLMVLPDAAAPAPLQAAWGAIGTATVERLSKNKHMLQCTVDGIAGQFVCVKNNAKFRAGMTMRVRKGKDKNIWNFEGNCPRYNGRW